MFKKVLLDNPGIFSQHQNIFQQEKVLFLKEGAEFGYFYSNTFFLVHTKGLVPLFEMPGTFCFPGPIIFKNIFE